MKDRERPPGQISRTWATIACAVAGVLLAAALYAQIPDATDTPPSWEYEVIRVAPPHQAGQLERLTRRINELGTAGWQYAGLLSLEVAPNGQSGVVLLRRLKL